ncbi:hypothetical protein HY311_00235 [Candidatus Nomurabacteria bacterium]|nr:hypothetical protein [Candidatus Nomurabacteria bacterium]
MKKNPTKKILLYLGSVASVIIALSFFAMLAAPEISQYFKHRGLPSDNDLKQSAIKKFDEYKINPIDDDPQKTTFAELGSTKFPYSMNYSYLIDSSLLGDEKLYLYSQAQEDWILVSETKRTFNNHELNEVSDWNVITQ